MTVADDIMKSLTRSLEFTATSKQLQERLAAIWKPGSIRSTLSRLTRSGTLERIERGTYKIKQLYQKFRHTKRIIETSSRNPINRWDLDVEATSEGLAPSWKTIPEIEAILNPKLINETLRILSDSGIYLAVEKVEFSIMGSELLGDYIGKYNPRHEVELVLVAKTRRYVFNGFFDVRLKEYE